jgi:hypothetical protein
VLPLPVMARGGALPLPAAAVGGAARHGRDGGAGRDGALWPAEAAFVGNSSDSSASSVSGQPMEA